MLLVSLIILWDESASANNHHDRSRDLWMSSSGEYQRRSVLLNGTGHDDDAQSALQIKESNSGTIASDIVRGRFLPSNRLLGR